MASNAHGGIRTALFFLVLLTMLPTTVGANSPATCNTPVYDGVCCDTAPTEYPWPSGNGCCIGGQPYPGPTCPFLLKNDAEFMTQTPPPSTMTTGQTATASITMKNNGGRTWYGEPNANAYHLGLVHNGIPVEQADSYSKTWGAQEFRQALATGETVAPGMQKTFAFQITAPATPGTYEFRWQMVQENVEWFGEMTPSITIAVAAALPTPRPSTQTSPTASPAPSISPSPASSVSATPGPTPSATSSPTAVPSATLPPNVRPDASITLSCPSNLVTTRNVTLATLTLSFGQATCDPTVELNVTSPKKTKPEVTPLGCVNGRSAFNVSTTGDGAYTAAANYSGSVDTCTFAIAGTPPQPTPEISPLLIFLVTAVAGLYVQRKR